MVYPSKLALSENELVAFVERRFGLKAGVVDIREGYMSTALFLDSGQAQYVLKVYRKDEADGEQIAFGLSVNDALEQACLPVAPRVGLCEEAGRLFVLWRRLRGRPYSPGSIAELKAAGEMLGQVHLVGESVRVSVWRPMWDAVCGELELLWEQMEDVGAIADSIADFRQRLGTLRVRVLAQDLQGLPVTVIHGDYRAQNLLFEQTQVSGVLDLDMARPAQRLFDLTYALAFFQAVLSSRPLGFDEMAIFLRAYGRKAGLTAGEKALLPAFLELALMRGMTLWMRIAYLDRVNRNVEGWFAPYLALISDLPQWGTDLAVRGLGKDG